MIAAETFGCSSTPRERAPELLRVGPDGVSAAFAVREGDHAIDVGRQFRSPVAVGDQFGGVGGAIAGGDHGDVIASPHAAILAAIAEKRGNVPRGAATGVSCAGNS